MLDSVLFISQYQAAEKFAPVFEAMGWGDDKQGDIESLYDEMVEGAQDDTQCIECGHLKVVWLRNGMPLFGLSITDTERPPNDEEE